MLTIPDRCIKGVQARGSTSSEPLAIILLIDISGSMSRTDPQRLRETAAGVFIDLLGHVDDKKVQLALAIFETIGVTVKFLGSYPCQIQHS